MPAIENSIQDVMQVCRNGHVITDLLRSHPEQARTHCDRCGAVTIDHCPTCGHELSGAFVVPGLQPVGVHPAPSYCSACGAAFPWTKQKRPPKRESLLILENLLCRLTRVIRQLRVRHGDRPPFRVIDERDLEDLMRALLPLHFEDIRPECRTPSYSACTRTDYLLAPEGIALTLKMAQPRVLEQVVEDASYYRLERKSRTLVVFVYDPEASLREPCLPTTAGAENGEEPEVRCVVGVS
jgi:hypothetical protein